MHHFWWVVQLCGDIVVKYRYNHHIVLNIMYRRYTLAILYLGGEKVKVFLDRFFWTVKAVLVLNLKQKN